MPPAFFDRLTDSCWSYMSWYCFGGLAVHEIAVAQRFVGRTHGLEHLVEEQRFEFLGDLADVRSPSRSLPTLSWLRRLRSV